MMRFLALLVLGVLVTFALSLASVPQASTASTDLVILECNPPGYPNHATGDAIVGFFATSTPAPTTALALGGECGTAIKGLIKDDHYRLKTSTAVDQRGAGGDPTIYLFFQVHPASQWVAG